MNWLSEIINKWQAGIAHVFLLHGNTADTVNGVHTVQDILVSSGLCAAVDAVILYDRSKGITFPLPSHRQAFYQAIGLDAPPDGEDVLPTDPVGALRLIGQVLGKTKHIKGGDKTAPFAAAVISFAETIAPTNDISTMNPDDRTVLVTLQSWARDSRFVAVGPPVFLIAENLTDVHPALRSASSRVETIHIPYPTHEERLEYIRKLSEGQGVRIDDINRAAAMTAGLKRVHIEDIILRARLEDRAVDADLIKLRKDEIVRAEFAEVLELIDPEYGFEAVGGMEHVKDFFRRNVINPIRSGNLRRVPLGVLLTGPPGTGKTLLAQAIAKESGINCAALNLSKIFDKWVGSSERALEKALACIDALAPVLVIIDEIDQAGLNRANSGDSGVSNRLFKRLLEYMSDTKRRGKICFVAASVSADTPVLIEKDGKAKLQQIGTFVDSFYSEDEDKVIKNVEGYQTLGIKDGKVKFVPFSGVYRHWVNEIFNVSYDGGHLKVTGNHAVFVFDEDRGIIAVPANSLRPKDYLVTFRDDVSETSNTSEWKVVDRRLEEFKKYEDVLEAYKRGLPQSEIGRIFGVNQVTVSNWVRGKHKPRRIGKQWELRRVVPLSVPITKELAELWGYYLAEGHARKSELSFCLGAHETELQERIKTLMKNVFSLDVSHEHSPVESEKILVYYSYDLAQAFLNCMGSSAHEKHVPPEIWVASPEIKRAFINAYLKGDGSLSKRHRWQASTVSKKIAQDIIWLLRCCNSSGRISYVKVPERIVNNCKLKETNAIFIRIPASHRTDEIPNVPRKRKPANCDCIPTSLIRTLHRQCRPTSTNDEMHVLPGVKVISKDRALVIIDEIWRRRRRDSEFYYTLRSIVLSPFGIAEIKSVSKQKTDEYVYDLVGAEGEAFFGGQQPILLHNSNRPDLLDAALKRPGRFDRKVPVLPPDAKERADIFRVMFKKYDIPCEANLETFAEIIEGYTGAEIEALVLKALEVAEDEGSPVVSNTHLKKALDAYVPTTRDIQAQVRLALAECNDRDLVPQAYRHLLEERKTQEAGPVVRSVRALP